MTQAGYWRLGDRSDEVYECRFTTKSCPGTRVLDDSHCSDAKWPYCACGYEGALCAVCARGYYETWGDSPCGECGSSAGHAPTAAIGACFFVLFVVGGGIARTRGNRIANSARCRIARYFYRLGKVKMRLIFFSSQVLSEFSLIASNTVDSGGDGFPEPALTFSRLLGVANLDGIALIPMGCAFPKATFYSKLVAKTMGPLVPILLLWARPTFHTLTGAVKWQRQQSARFAAKYSLLWIELTLTSVSTTIVEAFKCSEFDNESFLTAQLSLSCDISSPRRAAWVSYSIVAVLLYPLGE